AGTWHRPLFLTRDRWFESGSLHGESVLTGAQPRNLPRTPPPMGRRVIEILADSTNNRNNSPMETARDEVTAVGITIDRLACSAAAARDGRSAMIRTRPSGAGDRRARRLRHHGRKSR